LPEDAPKFIAAPDYPAEYQAPQRIYKAVYENDFLINYAIAKDHREAGITGAMKNNYGCTDNPVGTHGSVWKRRDSPYAGTRLCVPSFYKNVDQHAPFLLNIMDALTGVYQGGPLSGNVFHQNTIAVSKDPVALDSYLLNMINEARGKKGISLIESIDGWTDDGHPNASFLRVASEQHEMGSMSQENLQTFDITNDVQDYDLPVLEQSHSRVSEVRVSANMYQMQVYLDKSKRKHVIEARIEDPRGKVVRSFPAQSTVSSNITLEWDRKNDSQTTVEEGVYVWHVSVDGFRHTGTINGLNSN
jgi:hypothetical protein